MRMKSRIVVSACVIILAVAAIAVYVSKRHTGSAYDIEQTTRTLKSPRTEETTWDAFLSNFPRNRGSSPKVVFIGIDGGSWNVIDAMIAEGLLPTFEKIKREGSYGPLRSTDCYMSPPAWTTMLTGCLPKQTGVYTFGVWNRERQRFRNVSSLDVEVPSVWDIASHAGLRTAAINIPIAYPVRPVNGILISGLLTPVKLDDRERMTALKLEENKGRVQPVQPPPASYSPVLTTALEHHGNRFEYLLYDTRNDGKTAYDVADLTIFAGNGGSTKQTGTYRFNIGQYSDWIKIDFTGPNRNTKGWCRMGVLPARKPGTYAEYMSRVLFSYTDTDIAFAYPPSIIDAMNKRFDHYFPTTFMNGQLVPGLAEEATEHATFFYDYDAWDLYLYVFTQVDNSHHADGMSANTKRVYQTIDGFLDRLIAKLPEECTLMIASDHGFRSYERAVNFNRLLEEMGLLSFTDAKRSAIDYDRTLVFHNLWHLYFNDSLMTSAELSRRNIPCPPGSAPFDALCNYLQTSVPAALEEKHGVTMSTLELIPLRKGAGTPPDMAVFAADEHTQIEFWNFNALNKEAVFTLEKDPWDHALNGIYLAYGNGIQAGIHTEARNIQDIAPTILYLLGLPVSPHMDGRVIAPVLTTDILARRPLHTIADYDWGSWKVTTEHKDEGDLEKRLRSLGYVH